MYPYIIQSILYNQSDYCELCISFNPYSFFEIKILNLLVYVCNEEVISVLCPFNLT